MGKLRFIYALATFIAITVIACKEEAETKVEHKVNVKTAKVKEEIINTPIRTSGRIASDKEAKLSFKTGGVIKNVYVNEGSTVRRGQLLAQLDLAEIKANVKQAMLALEKAERDFKRAKNLYEDSVATLEQFQNANTALEYAQTNLKIAKFNLQHSTINAPNSGKILMRLAEPNEIIAPGHPVFLFGSTEKNWIVKVNITDKDIIKLKLGDSAKIHLDAHPYQDFSGQISEISNAADPYTGTYEVEVRLSENKKKIVSGMIAKVNIFPSSDKKCISIPTEALVEGNEYTGFVYKLENSQPKKVKIRIKQILDNKLIVTGLTSKEEVITEGAKFITPEVKINVVE